MRYRVWILGFLAVTMLTGCCRLDTMAMRYAYRCDDCGPTGLGGRFEDGSDCPRCAYPEYSLRDFSVSGMLQRAMTCCAGCGDWYVGEWQSDRRDDCVSCDRDGNWVGIHARRSRVGVRFLSGLRGHRYHEGECWDCAEGVPHEHYTEEYVPMDGYPPMMEEYQEPDGSTIPRPMPDDGEPSSPMPPDEASGEDNTARHPRSRLIRRSYY